MAAREESIHPSPASIPAHSGPSALDNAEIVFSEAFAPSATPPQEDTLQQPTPIGRKPPAVADPEEDPLQQPTPIGSQELAYIAGAKVPAG